MVFYYFNLGDERIMVKSLRSVLLAFIFAVAILFSSFSYIYAKANTKDHTYSFFNRDEGNLPGREKYNNSKVYVYPKTGPKAIYTVYGSFTKGDGYKICSDAVELTSGVKYTIRNCVNKCYYSYARLHFRGTGSYTYTKGVWSPDSTKDYKNVGTAA